MMRPHLANSTYGSYPPAITTPVPYNTHTTSVSPAASTGLIKGVYSKLFTPGKKRPSVTHTSSITSRRDATTTTNHGDNAKEGDISDTITNESASVVGIFTVVDWAEL